MKTLILAATAAGALAAAAPAAAQTMDHSRHMPVMTMPAAKPGADAACPPEHAAMGHCTPAAAEPAASPPAATSDPNCPPEHAAMGHCVAQATPAADTAPEIGGGTARPAGSAPAPVAPDADYADRVWGRDAMAPARDLLHREHGGMAFSQIMFNLAEVQFRRGGDGYRWDGEFWHGGDVNRLTVKSEGEGTFRDSAGGEVQALYSRAIGPYFNVQAGVRQDVAPGPNRTYATVGFEGLAPYWFDVEGALFLSDRGDVLGRVEGYYDQRITQRLILQPRVELALSAQDVRSSRLGSGVTDAEGGLRLRYEIAREFAPYVGVSWERTFGDTARYARTDGDGTGGFSFVAGVRTWF
ncbi:copper resistance protein B [Sphingomonas hankookensis]|uniref:copper resistance protein B n=1 Tax=Sphingomonas hankookensis TaxID=563996 RepID=UPI003D3023B0